jgi:hypothetical protein
MSTNLLNLKEAVKQSLSPNAIITGNDTSFPNDDAEMFFAAINKDPSNLNLIRAVYW